jgi:hypothetical protein
MLDEALWEFRAMDFYSVVLICLPTLAFMMLSEKMARVRSRSVRTWVSFAGITGPLPLAPLALYMLGSREKPIC